MAASIQKAPVLKVIAVPGHQVMDDVRAQFGERRYVGRAQAPAVPDGSLEEIYPPQACEYPDDQAHSYIKRNILKGGLKALDEYTARRGGVPFDRIRGVTANLIVADESDVKRASPQKGA